MTRVLTHLSMNFPGSEGQFLLPKFVVSDGQHDYLCSGGQPAGDGAKLGTVSAKSTMQLVNPYQEVGLKSTIGVIGPEYIRSVHAVGLDDEFSHVELTSLDNGFVIVAQCEGDIAMIRASIGASARRRLEDSLRSTYGQTWPDAGDELLHLFMADPSQPLQDQLLARALQKRLTDLLSFDRVVQFDAVRLGVDSTAFVRRLDDWQESLSRTGLRLNDILAGVARSLEELQFGQDQLARRLDKVENSNERSPASTAVDDQFVVRVISDVMNRAILDSREAEMPNIRDRELAARSDSKMR